MLVKLFSTHLTRGERAISTKNIICKNGLAYQNVDITTSVEAVRKPLPRTSEEETSDALLDVLETEDGRSDGPGSRD